MYGETRRVGRADPPEMNSKKIPAGKPTNHSNVFIRKKFVEKPGARLRTFCRTELVIFLGQVLGQFSDVTKRLTDNPPIHKQQNRPANRPANRPTPKGCGSWQRYSAATDRRTATNFFSPCSGQSLILPDCPPPRQTSYFFPRSKKRRPSRSCLHRLGTSDSLNK